MPIDSNGRYLSAFKQCKLQLRVRFAPKPFALFTVKAGVLLFHYQARALIIPLIVSFRELPYLASSRYSLAVHCISDVIQHPVGFIHSFHHERREGERERETGRECIAGTAFVSKGNAFILMRCPCLYFRRLYTFAAGA